VASHHQVHEDHRDVQVVVDNPEVPCLDLVVDIRTVDTHRPCEVVDIQDTVDNQDTADIQPYVGAFQGAFHRVLPRIHVVVEDIPEVELHHPLLLVVEEILHIHEVEAEDNHTQEVVVVHLAYI